MTAETDPAATPAGLDDAATDMENRRKRVRFRCHHTGMKENDLLFGAFADRHLPELSDADVIFLETLLGDNNDIDLYNWITGKEPVPDAWQHPLMQRLQAFRYVQ